MKKHSKLYRIAVVLFFATTLVATVSCSSKTGVKETSSLSPQIQSGQSGANKGKGTETALKMKAAEKNPAVEAKINDIHFEFDKYSLKPEARKNLDRISTLLKSNVKQTIRIEGNCDERGTTEYNLALGEKRAKTAMDYLRKLGIDGKRITTISYGKEKPLDAGHTEEAWAKNRRDHFVILIKN